MTESPVLIEPLEERERDTWHRGIPGNVGWRFGTIPEDLTTRYVPSLRQGFSAKQYRCPAVRT
jgi:hypothetical protein